MDKPSQRQARRIKTLIVFLALAVTGCHTPKSLVISPPGTRAAKSFQFPDRRNIKPFDPSRLPKYQFIAWDNCSPQPDGVIYRVYDTDDFSYWALYDETMLTFCLISTVESECRFYTVSAYLDGVEVWSTTKPCP